MNKMLLLIFVVVANFIFAQQYNDVSEVPNPKESGNMYVSNPDGIIDDATEEAINGILASIETKDTFQVALVCLNSIGTNVPKDFATDLFNHWKIGLASKDNGVLVLFVLDQRRIEIETGDGTEAVLSDYQCTQIIDEYMISDFKEGDYGQGLLRGMNGLALHFSGKTIDSYNNHSSNDDYSNYDYEYNSNYVPFYKDPSFWIVILIWQLTFVVALIIALFFIRSKNDPYQKHNIIRYFNLGIYFLLFPIAYLLLFTIIKGLRERYRNAIRFSGKTGAIMHKLNDQEEDNYLSSGQLTEEIVRSVDYDVWLEDAAEEILILPYRPIFSSYTKCPKCGFSTYIKDYDRQLVAATTYSTGTGERKHSCKHCKHEVIQTYTIAKISKSSTSSSGGWSSGGSSGGWSGGGGSSSWGGGRSSGGGGGRSW